MSEMICKLKLEPLNIRRTNNDSQYSTKPLTVIQPYPLVILSQFCVALVISIAKHTIPSTPAKPVTNILSSPGQ